jgi:hypothetical protein
VLKPVARHLRLFAIVAAALLASVAVLNWRVDPLHHYRAEKDGFLVGAARFRLPGLARHCEAGLVIAGTSVSVHQQPDVFQKFHHDPKDPRHTVLNLAMDGATAHEQYLLLRLALRTGRVKEVIWDLNYEYLRGKPGAVSDFDGTFPGYLYDDSALNDLPNYLLSISTAKDSLRILAKKYQRQSAGEFAVLKPGVPHGPAAIAKAMERRKKGAAAFRELIPELANEHLRASFAHNHAALIREFPNVTFRLYFPPFSSAYFDFLRGHAPELLPVFLRFREDIFAAVKELPNAELHDIQSDITLITDLSRYADPIHFDAETHVRIAADILGQSHRASAERLSSFQRWLDEFGR